MHYRISAILPAKELQGHCLFTAHSQARNLYLQNWVQLFILHAYPKVPKQNTPEKKSKEAIKVQLNPSLQNCLKDTNATPAPSSAHC